MEDILWEFITTQAILVGDACLQSLCERRIASSETGIVSYLYGKYYLVVQPFRSG